MRWIGTNSVAAGLVLVVQHFTLGRNNGLRVSALSLGTATFGGRWGYGAEPDVARQIFDKFAGAGGTFIDTAASYQGGESEEYVSRLVAGRRDQFVVATKFSIGSDQQGTACQSNSEIPRPLPYEPDPYELLTWSPTVNTRILCSTAFLLNQSRGGAGDIA